MENAGMILVTSVAITGLVSFAVASYKTGFVSFLAPSHLRGGQPKYEIDNSKAGEFAVSMGAAFLLNILYGLAIVQDLHEIEAVVAFAALNMVFITYALVYWVLFKEKKGRH